MRWDYEPVHGRDMRETRNEPQKSRTNSPLLGTSEQLLHRTHLIECVLDTDGAARLYNHPKQMLLAPSTDEKTETQKSK